MINISNYSSTNRSAYPGEYIPNPTVYEKFNKHSTPKGKNAIFSQINISEDPEYFLLELDTAGLRRKDFIVTINEKGNLSVSGIHKELSGLLTDEYNQTYSEFSREIVLPKNIDTDFVKAQFRAGVLSIWFLKTNKPYPKRPSFVVVY